MLLVFKAQKHFLVDSLLQMEEYGEDYQGSYECRKNKFLISLEFLKIFRGVSIEDAQYRDEYPSEHDYQRNWCYEYHAFVKVVV